MLLWNRLPHKALGASLIVALFISSTELAGWVIPSSAEYLETHDTASSPAQGAIQNCQQPVMPDIFLLISGAVLVSVVRDGASAQSDEFQVGILRDAPDHELFIAVYTLDRNGECTVRRVQPVRESLSLKVKRAPCERVTLHQVGEFHRDAGPEVNDPYDFRWALDLESQEGYKGPVTLDPNGIRSVFSVNQGLFHTLLVSKNDFIKMKPNGKKVRLGPVATLIGAFIDLGNDGRATFWDGNEKLEIKPGDPQITLILISQYRQGELHHIYNDSVLHHQAVVGTKGDVKRFRFDATELPRTKEDHSAVTLEQHLKDKEHWIPRFWIEAVNNLSCSLETKKALKEPAKKTDPSATCGILRLSKNKIDID